jgi:hypothetical protein
MNSKKGPIPLRFLTTPTFATVFPLQRASHPRGFFSFSAQEGFWRQYNFGANTVLAKDAPS